MPEEKDTSFKVTDRRKYHPDGTPRDPSAEQQSSGSADEQAATQAQEGSSNENASGNVVSFPSDAKRKREQAASEPSTNPPPQPDQDAAADNAERAAAVKAAADAAEQAYNQTKTARAANLPEPSFLALTDMLAGEAAMCLGLAQTPDGSKLPIDLETARTMIDMLGMLDQKTKGNLSAEESSVLENVLAYLRMQFVALSRTQ